MYFSMFYYQNAFVLRTKMRDVPNSTTRRNKKEKKIAKNPNVYTPQL